MNVKADTGGYGDNSWLGDIEISTKNVDQLKQELHNFIKYKDQRNSPTMDRIATELLNELNLIFDEKT